MSDHVLDALKAAAKHPESKVSPGHLESLASVLPIGTILQLLFSPGGLQAIQALIQVIADLKAGNFQWTAELAKLYPFIVTIAATLGITLPPLPPLPSLPTLPGGSGT